MVLSIAADILMYRALMQNTKTQELTQKLNDMQHEMDMQLQYYDGLADKMREIREYRHDINNLIEVTESLLRRKTTSEDGRMLLEELKEKTAADVTEAFTTAAAAYYEQKEQEFTSPVMREVERVVLLRVVDEYWMDHIDAMADLRQGIRLRAYAQTDPIIAYKKESLDMFEEMISAIQSETVRRLYSVRIKKDEEIKRERVAKATGESVGGDGTVKKQPRRVQKIGRNDPCPCGSGKKYKNCCGRNA